MNAESKPSEATLRELVRGIVESVHPRRIILFGSAARGQMGPHSDLDVLVVMPDGTHRRETAMQLYSEVRGLGIATDYVIVTEEDIARYGSEPSLVICPALEDGREVYRAP